MDALGADAREVFFVKQRPEVVTADNITSVRTPLHCSARLFVIMRSYISRICYELVLLGCYLFCLVTVVGARVLFKKREY